MLVECDKRIYSSGAMIPDAQCRIKKENSWEAMNSIFWENAEIKTKLLSTIKIYVNKRIDKVTGSNLGRTVDSSIAKWGIEGNNEAKRENVGLKVLEKGHQVA